MAKLSRIVPPRSDITTIMPALVGASRIVFHSSGAKSACLVIGTPGLGEKVRARATLTVPSGRPRSEAGRGSPSDELAGGSAAVRVDQEVREQEPDDATDRDPDLLGEPGPAGDGPTEADAQEDAKNHLEAG